MIGGFVRAGALLALATLGATGATRAATFASAGTPYTLAFPRDHAAHPAYASEWWYYTGHLRVADGRRFGYELTFFRIGLRPGDPPPRAGESRWRGSQLFPAHLAITDERGKRFVHAELFEREALGMGHADAARLDVNAGGWTLRGAPMHDRARERMTMHASAGADALDLVQEPQKRPAIHGHGGVSKKAACATCASHYYSYTRLRTTGTLTYGGVRLPVTSGTSWMDHEFGSGQLSPRQAGWDWFAIQLDDGRELMLYRLREKDGRTTPQSSGSLVARDGTVTYLPLSAFAIDARDTWRSPHTGGTYPSGWRVRVPQAGLDLSIDPTIPDQELANALGGISYWEGSVDVRDVATKRSLGVGYVELTGYAGAVRL